VLEANKINFLSPTPAFICNQFIV